MRNHIRRYRLALSAGLVVLAVGTVFWIRGSSHERATAGPPQPPPQTEAATPAAAASSTEYSQRVVAYIHDTIPVTREELGEYLIARLGAERLNNMVNRRIIEQVCREKGIEVSEAEVEAELARSIRGLAAAGISTLKDFETQILKHRHMNLYEWKEDNIRPELMMKKLCRDRVQVTDEDLQKAFEAYHGEKVNCRIILWPKKEKHIAVKMYGKVRDSEEEFDRAARSQSSHELASAGGRVRPIGHNTTGNPALEKAAFSLRPNEVSELIEAPEGYVVVKCLERVPPDTGVTLETEKATLSAEIIEKKLQLEIPKAFAELRVKAHPTLLLGQPLTEEELRRDVERLLQDGTGKSDTLPAAPGLKP